MRWLNNTLKERVNTKNKKEAMKLINRAAFPYPSKANAQRRHVAELYLDGVVNKKGLRQLLERIAYAVPPVSPAASPKRPSKGIPIPRKPR